MGTVHYLKTAYRDSTPPADQNAYLEDEYLAWKREQKERKRKELVEGVLLGMIHAMAVVIGWCLGELLQYALGLK
jgi:hypothetical protein